MLSAATRVEIHAALQTFLEFPHLWTKRAEARDAQGRTTGGVSSDAVCWCMYGLIVRNQPAAAFEMQSSQASEVDWASEATRIMILNDEAGSLADLREHIHRAYPLPQGL